MAISAIEPINRAVERLAPPAPYWQRPLPRPTAQAADTVANRTAIKVPVDTTRGTKLDIYV